MILLLGFSFSSEVWGTVSDWTMVFVTIVTAYFLYRTLQSQKDVQKTQNELFKIESLRFRESIKPVLKYSILDNGMKSDDKKKKILTIQVTNETDSTALKISRFVAENEHTKQLFVAMGYPDKRDHLTKGDNPLLFHFGIDSDSPASGFISFVMKYQDIADTKYQQRIFCICDDCGTEIHPSLPEIIN